MSTEPLISVIVPYCDTELELFQLAIHGILSQSYKNWEVIIVNDGSTPKNKALIEELIKKINDQRFSIIDLGKNYGPSHARNVGVENSKGEIIIFLDADDIHLPWYYKEVINCFKENPSCLMVGTPPLFYIPNKKKIYLDYHRYRLLSAPENIMFLGFKHLPMLCDKEEKLFKDLAKRLSIKRMFFSTPRLALKKEVFNIVKYDPGFVAIEDTEFCLSLVSKPELLEHCTVNFNFGYLYRLYSLKNRHTRKTNLNFRHMSKIATKHSIEGSLTQSIIRHWKMKDEWKYCSSMARILTDDGKSYITKTVQEAFQHKAKWKALYDLCNLLFKHKILSERLGIDFRMRELPKGNNIDKTKDIQELFQTHINNSNCKEFIIQVAASIF
ncbi:MAG: glycosyltransferase family 2 protein [Candidatus Melainabacteria bacterium]|nr:glycosyltransferase family 2 protein [Candidatus Melainabacteria bacterium]